MHLFKLIKVCRYISSSRDKQTSVACISRLILIQSACPAIVYYAGRMEADSSLIFSKLLIFGMFFFIEVAINGIVLENPRA